MVLHGKQRLITTCEAVGTSGSLSRSRAHWPRLIGLVTLITLLCGCSNTLSKEQAKTVLRDGGQVEAPRCSVKLPVETEFKFGNFKLEAGACAKRLTASGLIDAEFAPTMKPRPVARMNCKEQDDGGVLHKAPYGYDCSLEFACGSSDVAINSITTEGAHATIRFTRTAAIDPKFLSDWPSECPLDRDFAKVTQGTATATRADDGTWMLGK